MSTVPDGVTPINASNESIADLDLLQEAIERALTMGQADVYFTDRERAQEIESSLPASAFQDDPVAYYVTADGSVVKIKIVYYL